MKPLIAVTIYGRLEKPLPSAYYHEHVSLPIQYIAAVRRAGGIPLLVAPGEPHLDELLARVDGVLVAGGADIDPAVYGGNREHPKLTNLDAERDELELGLVRKVVDGKRPLPTLCICRGMQVLNVALGGTMHEHVADVLPEDIHRGDDGLWAMQPVTVNPTSQLAEIMQADHVVTASGHHQAVKDVGEGLTVVATAPDGVIEAIEHAGLPWLVGVQWHPEVTAAEDPTQQRLFDELVAEASRNR